MTPLQALEQLKYYNTIANDDFDMTNELVIIEKALKALEIIKEKRVNLEYLKCCESYEQYCLICSYGNELTKEIFDLLKEQL